MSFNHIGNYECVCGKKFNNSQAFNGHKCHCKEWQLKTYGNLNKYFDTKLKRDVGGLKGSKNVAKKKLEAKKTKFDKWISEQHTCEACGNVMTEYYGSGRFCSSKCAKSFATSNNREEINIKISKSLCGKIRQQGNVPTRDIPKKFCNHCGKELGHRNKSGLCQDCNRKYKVISEETKQKLSNIQKELVKQGKHKGWNTRDKVPSTEKLWMKILEEHNIKYSHDYIVPKKSIGIKGYGVYRLDFLLGENIDLEIDSEIHKREDRMKHDQVRDTNLINAGYKIYRIKCYSKEYKENLDEVIRDFISWYNMNI